MPRTGATHNLLSNTNYPAIEGEVIDQDGHNAMLEDLSQGLTDSVSRDGAGNMSGDLNMGSNKLTNLAAGSAPGHSVRYEQVQLASAVATAWEGLSWAANKLGYATGASTFALIDVGTIVSGYATTATAAGTTTLTATSERRQFFTGTTTQTVALPVVSTLVLGHTFEIVNNSTGLVTVNSSGGNAVVVIPAGGRVVVECILLTGTTAASWSVTPLAVLTAPNTFTAAIPITVSHATPRTDWYETDGAANSKLWSVIIDGGFFTLQTRTDADGSGGLPVSIQRSGTTVVEIAFVATTVSANGSPVMTRAATETVTGVKTFADTQIMQKGVTITGLGGGGVVAGAIMSDSNAGMYFRAAFAQPFKWLKFSDASTLKELSDTGALRLNTYGAGTLVTDSSGNVTASSDEELKYFAGDYTRGLADLRAMDGPIRYQWKGEQIELAEALDTLASSYASLEAAKSELVTAKRVAAAEDATEADDERLQAATFKVQELDADIRRKEYLISLSRQDATYTGWTAQGVRRGVPEAVKSAPDGSLCLDERPILATHHNAILELEAMILALQSRLAALETAP